ncbi:Flavin-Reduct domain-containing protein [Mycena indigotica]|uniref:Flavin-Reduct domain-containing protein n=1 Tax=Mycena indigotica TaxID=2126181 RepID=A0A8H6S452_9AGAR|nr:Flavin-Reduct domain-containing protein [Mycena indigotica]KAF7291983.1 Flavin-Reduct domain-containing protein [Mycena indigotica]
MADLPPFEPTSFKYTQSPNPSWSFGDPITTTEDGRKWVEDEKQGWKTIDATKEDPRTLYALSVSGLVPRPIAFVSSVAANGSENIAPFSWFNQVSTNPPVISVSCSPAGRHKDTANNIRETKGFTVNIISEPWIVQANAASIDAPAEINEWTVTGLTKEPSISVTAARVKESAFTMECELLQHIEIKNAAGGVAADLILGTVKYIHIRNAVLNDRGLVDPVKLRPVSRLGEIAYATIGDVFRIPRPVWKDEKDELENKFGNALL